MVWIEDQKVRHSDESAIRIPPVFTFVIMLNQLYFKSFVVVEKKIKILKIIEETVFTNNTNFIMILRLFHFLCVSYFLVD